MRLGVKLVVEWLKYVLLIVAHGFFEQLRSAESALGETLALGQIRFKLLAKPDV